MKEKWRFVICYCKYLPFSCSLSLTRGLCLSKNTHALSTMLCVPAIYSFQCVYSRLDGQNGGVGMSRERRKDDCGDWAGEEQTVGVYKLVV